jgi:hypothetical protein
MFMVGRTEEGSSNAPTRTPVTSGLVAEFANKGDPHVGQKRCRIWLPLAAVLTNSVNCPEISSAAVGTSKFTWPLADMRWQSRHQQILAASGSAERRKRMAPHRHRPVLSVMGFVPTMDNAREMKRFRCDFRIMFPNGYDARKHRLEHSFQS